MGAVGVDVACGITGVGQRAIDTRDDSDGVAGVVMVGAAGVAHVENARRT